MINDHILKYFNCSFPDFLQMQTVVIVGVLRYGGRTAMASCGNLVQVLSFVQNISVNQTFAGNGEERLLNQMLNRRCSHLLHHQLPKKEKCRATGC
jgi:hypothetical protein